MDRASLRGHAQTVLGPVAPEALGRTLMHEHLLVDIRPPSKRGPADLGETPARLDAHVDVHPSLPGGLGKTRQGMFGKDVSSDESGARHPLAHRGALGDIRAHDHQIRVAYRVGETTLQLAQGVVDHRPSVRRAGEVRTF